MPRSALPHLICAGLLAAAALGSAGDAAAEGARKVVVVSGVGADDMLKLRAGPGTGYKVIAGFPDGTELVERRCDRVGGTPWCEVSLRAAPRLRGYVSGHYLARD